MEKAGDPPLGLQASGTYFSMALLGLSLLLVWTFTLHALRQEAVVEPGLIQQLVSLSVLLSLLLCLCVVTLVRRLIGQVRQREVALLAGEKFKNQILDAIAAEIAVVDRQGTILAVNAPWQNFAEDNAADRERHGCTMIGTNYFDVCQVDPNSPEAADAQAAQNGMQDVLEGRCAAFSMEYPCDSPTEKRWFTMVAHPLGERACNGLVVTHVDVTRIKEAEASAQQRLHEQRKAEQESRKLLQAIEQSPISMFITDRAGVIEYVNPRFIQTTGYSRSELIGRTPALLSAGTTPKSTYHSLWNNITKGKSWRGVLCNRTKAGEMVWEDTSISPIQDESGEATHFAVVKEDVTERLRIERELAEHQQRLEELVEQRTAELSLALEAAQVADRTKNEFLANITHELRTPLNAVIGFAGLARPLAANASQRDYLDKIVSSGKTLAATIDDLLDLSKIVAGCLKFEAKPFSIRALLARCNSVISYKASEKGLQLHQMIDANVPEILIGDTLRIEQIILNLMSNAVKFTDSGSVSLSIATGATREGKISLELVIRDSGIGMRDDDIRVLFQPFTQADNSITRRFGGTGLGLAICARLARMMDGDIRVSSTLGSGTTFHVQIWVEPGCELDTADEHAAQTPAQQIRYRNTRVLIVDDHPFNRELVCAMLTAVGISYRTANHGQEAIDQIISDSEDFDLVLMDIQMPVMDGLTATRELRNMPRFASLPIIAMTAHTMKHERERGAQAGMNDHVGKPFNNQAFYQTLARWTPRAKQFVEPPAQAPETTPELLPNMPHIPGVNSTESIQLMQGDTKRYQRWLREFLTFGPNTLVEINTAMRTGDREAASMATHRLKGRSGFLGMYETHRLSSELELAIDGGNEYGELVGQLEHKVGELCEDIEARIGLC